MYKKLYLSILFLLCMICLSYKYANLAFASSTRLEDSIQKESEINLFYGKRGFSVVISPRLGTNEELNELLADLVKSFLQR